MRRSKAQHWDLALVPAPIAGFREWMGAAGCQLAVSASVPGEFFRADPFALVRGGCTTLMFERYDLVARRGEIWTAELTVDARLEGERLALPLPCHASYPFLLEAEGEVFCVPETHLLGEVALYRAWRFPDAWVKETVLLSHARLADATLVHFEDRWWLACVSLDLDSGAATERLLLFHAPRLTGPFTPHAANPVRIDRQGARPGGTPFVLDGRLYRPGQDCRRSYGGGIVIHEVLELTPTVFRERAVATLSGEQFGAEGVHTLSAAGDRTLIDLKNAPRPRRS